MKRKSKRQNQWDLVRKLHSELQKLTPEELAQYEAEWPNRLAAIKEQNPKDVTEMMTRTVEDVREARQKKNKSEGSP